MKVLRWILVWLQGYEYADVVSLAKKLTDFADAGYQPGVCVPMTRGEWNAWKAGRVLVFDGKVFMGGK